MAQKVKKSEEVISPVGWQCLLLRKILIVGGAAGEGHT